MGLQSNLPGVFLFILLVSALLTAPLSMFLLWLYRRAVLRGMSRAAGVVDASLPSPVPAPPSRSLRITAISQASLQVAPEGRSRLDLAMTSSLRRVMLAYVIAGLAFAVVITSAMSVQAGEGFLPIRSLVLIVVFAWPLVLALSQLAALGGRDRLTFVVLYSVLYLILLVVGGVVSSAVNAGGNPLLLIGLWPILNGPPTLLLLAFLTRRIRSVGPLVLVFMVAAVTGSFVLVTVVGNSEQVSMGLVGVFGVAGLGGVTAFICLNLAGFVLLGVVGWGLLHLLGRRYRLKKLSDQSLTLDAMWLLFAVGYSILLVSEDWRWIFTSLVAFGVYKLILWGAFAWFLRPAVADQQPPMLLVLRVFSLGPRSLRLFDALVKYWLRVGPIALIAGPDLATGIVEPPEFLDFVGGRVSRSFVQGRDDLEQRLAQVDTRPDPDGRYRVNGFFCRADTWQMTMRQLAAKSDTVLVTTQADFGRERQTLADF